MSTWGRVRNKRTGIIRKNVDNGRGYFKFPVMKDKKNSSYYVHRLVALAFIPNPEQYDTVNHIDGDKHNNKIENLEWCSQKENVNHAIRIGISNPDKSSILTEDAVRFIRENHKPHCKQFGTIPLAEMFNCCVKTISNIVANKTYKEIL